MATILFAAAGAALGSGFGGTVLGLSGAVLGRAAGATLGRMVDQRVLGLGSEPVEVGRLDRFQIMGASEGTRIPRCWGRMRLPGQVIWASPFQESRSKVRGGKGMPSPKISHFSYSVSLAIGLCEGEILGVGRIWADGSEITPQSLIMRVYNGSEDQLPDPVIEAIEGTEEAPSYRGLAYVVLESFDLSPFGNRVPQLSFEVIRRAQGPTLEGARDLQDAIRAVALIPGTGEYALATQKVQQKIDFGAYRTFNISLPTEEPDLLASLRQLNQELPNCGAVSLVVSWFGNDLRCPACSVQPKVERSDQDVSQMPWRAGGISRAQAEEVPRIEGRSIFGGTPADSSVIQAIEALRNQGKDVMFYPFVLMEQIEGNSLPDPYSATLGQPALPWRGRITLSVAPNRGNSPDRTALARAEVNSFYGSASVNDFAISDGEIVYTGPQDWGYRRFILHYAHLCNLAGGVESFCIGSELRGLTQIRAENDSFPAVEALSQLAADVRSILGPAVKIGYAADWSEYFGYHPNGDVYFHLDPLWAHDDIDFVGIDNYMPISDWRNGGEHADQHWGSVYNIEYLKSNITGGEGFDWFYDSLESAASQRRFEITDIGYDEPWVFRYKDLKSWWASFHHNRIAGVRSAEPTDWVPGSKPIRFTEYGCPAVENGTNEPNRFLDQYSSESGLPRASRGGRDDFLQMQYFRAYDVFLNDNERNVWSERYSGRMIDINHCYAWAWDARPYPEFPRDTDKWIDGKNYARGHWLNGRSTAVPLDLLINEIVESTGTEAPDVTTLYGSIDGYCSDSGTTRAALQPLSTTYFFDVIERDGMISFLTRGSSKLISLNHACTALSDELTDSVKKTHQSTSETVDRIRLGYISSSGDYLASVVEGSLEAGSSANSIETEYNLALSNSSAYGIARAWLAEIEATKDTLSTLLPLSASLIELGATVMYEGLKYRVDRLEWADQIQVEAVRVEPAHYDFKPLDWEYSHWKSYNSRTPMKGIFLDIPSFGDETAPQAPYVAVFSDPWKGNAVLWSSAEDVDYQVNTVITSPATIGTTLNELVGCWPGVFDRGAALRVQFPSGSVSSVSEASLLSGANFIAVGTGDPNGWEVLQFQSANLVGPDTYELSVRLRGQAGTEGNILATRPSGSYVVVLDSDIPKISLSRNQLGVEQHYRLGFASETIDQISESHKVTSFSGNWLVPYSVCHLSVRTDQDGNDSVSWIRRSRVGSDSWAGLDVPLGEEAELYQISVFTTDGVYLQSYQTSVPSFHYTVTAKALDSVISPYYLEVCQVSLSSGTSSPKRILVGSN